MKKFLTVFVLVFIFSCEFVALGADFNFDGVSGFIKGRAQEGFRIAISTKGTDWMCEAFAGAINKKRSTGRFGFDIKKLFYQDAQIKNEVRQELKNKIKAWLPGEIKNLIVNDLFGSVADKEAVDEAMAIAERVTKELDTSFNDQIDEVIGGMYNEAVTYFENKLNGNAATSWIDVTDLKASVKNVFELGTFGNIAASELGRVVGDATARGLRGRVEDLLNGQLPPEAIDMLKKGPEEFEKYINEAKKYLPGEALHNFTKSVFNRPRIKLPTAAYASILAATAAGHFARAFKGVFVDPYELKRGVEVTRVMVWQIKNKKWINLSIMQIAGLARNFAEQFGLGQVFDGVTNKIKAPLDKVQNLADKVDKFTLAPVKEINDELKSFGDQIQHSLVEIQNELVSPMKNGLDKFQSELNQVGNAVADLVPDEFNGIPKDFKTLKEKLDLKNGIFGEFGNNSVKDLVEKTSLGDAAKKVKNDFSQLNDALADKLSEGAAEVLESVHLLGPTAAILDVERIPAINESESKELDPVLLHNGEFFYKVTDFEIPGRGINVNFTRTYRSRGNFLGEMGFGWTHSYAERLLQWNDGSGEGLTHIDEYGKKFFFRIEKGVFIAPPGIYQILTQNLNGYELTSRDGMETFFDLAGKPVKKCDRHGNCIEYIYDDRGILSSISDVFGRQINIVRREDGLITKVSDFSGRSFSFEYNKEMELVGASVPPTPDFLNPKVTAYRYTHYLNTHQMTMIMDPKSQVYLKNKYDEDGRVVAQSYGEAPWANVSYGEGSNDVATRAWVTDALGVTRAYEHDEAGHLLRLWKYSAGSYQLKVANEYNNDGEILSSCLPSGRCRMFTYGEEALIGDLTKDEYKYGNKGELIEKKNADGTISHYSYFPASDPDGDGVPVRSAREGDVNDSGYIKSIERNSEKTFYTYDPLGNITSITRPDGQIERYRVNALNQIVHEELPGEPPKDYSFDANDNLVRFEAGVGDKKIVKEFEYDVLDHLTKVREKISNDQSVDTQYTYNNAGLLVDITEPEGNKVEFEYDDDGRLACIIKGANSLERSRECIKRNADEKANVHANVIREAVEPFGVEYELDNLGRPTRVIRKGGDEKVFANYKWDGNGRLASLTDANGNTTNFGYDAQNRLVSEHYYNGTERLISYNEDGYVSGVIDRNGTILKIEYDASGRIISRNSVPARGVGGVEQYFKYDEKGRLVEARDSNHLSRFVYDSSSRPVAESFGDEWISRDFDESGRVIAETLPSGRTIYYSYNSKGKTDAVLTNSGRLSTFEYDVDGNLIGQKLGEELSLVLKRNKDGYVSTKNYYKDAGVLIAGSEIHRENGIVSEEINFDGVRREYGYDSFGRLASVRDFQNSYGADENPDGTSDLMRWEYNYDATDNLVFAKENGDELNLFWKYDANGNLISDGKMEFRYDALNRLTGVWNENGLVAKYDYDVFDRRVSKTINGETYSSVWDGWRLIEETEPDTAKTDYVYAAESLIPFAKIENDQTQYLFSDRVGSVVALSDSTGSILERYSYAPYGRPLQAHSMFGYAGYIYDEETGLIYLRHRYLDPNLGRFITPDPLDYKTQLHFSKNTVMAPFISYHKLQGQASKSTFSNRPNDDLNINYEVYPFNRIFFTKFSNFQSGELNLYLYAQGNPSNFVDPLGLATLVFDRSENRIRIYDGNGNEMTSYAASNNVRNTAADPFARGGLGPFPNGTYSVGVPEFYSQTYRQNFYDRFGLGTAAVNESNVTGPNWAGRNQENYNVSQGSQRIRIGADTNDEDGLVWRRGLFLHAGRFNDYTHRTLGCIRARDDELETLIANFISLSRHGDPVTQITVQD